MSIRLTLRSLLATSFLSSALLACGGGSSTSAASGGGTTPTAAASDPSCPVAVAGTSVSVEDTDTGAALVFVTTGDAGEVRRRVEAMAKMHNDHHGSMGPLPDGTAGGGGHEGHDMSGHAGHDMSGGGGHAGHDMSGGNAHAGHAGGMIGVHSKATVSEAPNGARLTFVANGGDVAKLQGELRMHAQHMASGTCEMGK